MRHVTLARAGGLGNTQEDSNLNDRAVLQMRQVSYVMAQAVAAYARIEGMKAENAARERHDYSPAYTEEAFEQVIRDFCLGHNDVMTILTEGQ